MLAVGSVPRPRPGRVAPGAFRRRALAVAAGVDDEVRAGPQRLGDGFAVACLRGGRVEVRDVQREAARRGDVGLAQPCRPSWRWTASGRCRRRGTPLSRSSCPGGSRRSSAVSSSVACFSADRHSSSASASGSTITTARRPPMPCTIAFDELFVGLRAGGPARGVLAAVAPGDVIGDQHRQRAGRGRGAHPPVDVPGGAAVAVGPVAEPLARPAGRRSCRSAPLPRCALSCGPFGCV